MSPGLLSRDIVGGLSVFRYDRLMVPQHIRSLFWDTKLETFDPAAYPVYTIERVLEHGDEDHVAWLLEVFSREQVRGVLRTNRNLSPRSANFWALVFGVPSSEVAALRSEN